MGHKAVPNICTEKPTVFEQHAGELGGESPTQYSADPNSGSTAVIRNLSKVPPPRKEGVFHAVGTDRFYTSVQLVLQLLARNVYSVGTTQTNKKGFSTKLITKDNSRPSNVLRGSSTVAVAKHYVGGTDYLYTCYRHAALQWLKPAQFTVNLARLIAGGQRIIIACPPTMRDYHSWMGGVDIHNQLRLQRYSLTPTACAISKVVQNYVFGTVGYGHHKCIQPDIFDASLHRKLSGHKLIEFLLWTQIRDRVRKRPQHQCKVCSNRNAELETVVPQDLL
ncbi:Hypothetical protein PHPALM_14370 [Phytophthora palmivora]|uniref:PiggyBac transposable element-derived protein domain-containing protein n=1 Tax=Phytophthora palmivora TaxID=4796 RepID=A0A2P4XUW3_9STRA|nr:Hypothetical protein PHPALM_14370 [Phytophthora palmivora]